MSVADNVKDSRGPVSVPGRGRPDEGARSRVVDAALALFLEQDYDAVSTETIIRRADVSRGALYHHFPSKIDVFRAVFQASELRLIERLVERIGQPDGPFATLQATATAYLHECESSHELRRIGLQSRSVLGWDGWRDAARDYGLGLSRALVVAAIDAGEMKPGDPDVIAHVALGAIIEGAMLVATADDPAQARARVEPVVHTLLDGLRPSHEQAVS